MQPGRALHRHQRYRAHARQQAFGLHDEQFVGDRTGSTNRFDTVAKAKGYDGPAAFRDLARLMLRLVDDVSDRSP